MFRRLGCQALVKDFASISNTVSKRANSAVPSSAGATAAKYDVVIIGAGCVGSLIAFWLKKKASALRILVIDRDLAVNS